MNNSTTNLELESDTISLVLTALGIFTLLENAAMLMLLTKLLVDKSRNKDPVDFIAQVFFVCFNDTLCGLALTIYGTTRIEDLPTAYLCGYVILSLIALQTVSLGNMLCIFIQRFICIRRIRINGPAKKLHVSKILLLVNILFGGVSLISAITNADIQFVRKGTHIVCALESAVKNGLRIVAIFYIQLIILLLLSDAICIITILKLRREMANIVQPDGTNSNSDCSSLQQETTRRLFFKNRQQKAVATLFLILVFINLSIFPSVFGHTLFLLGYDVPLETKKMTLLCMYLNATINPVITVTRTQDIRKCIQECYKCIKSKF